MGKIMRLSFPEHRFLVLLLKYKCTLTHARTHDSYICVIEAVLLYEYGQGASLIHRSRSCTYTHHSTSVTISLDAAGGHVTYVL